MNRLFIAGGTLAAATALWVGSYLAVRYLCASAGYSGYAEVPWTVIDIDRSWKLGAVIYIPLGIVDQAITGRSLALITTRGVDFEYYYTSAQ